MTEWPEIPMDVVEWIRSVFGEANRRTAERLVNFPNIHEVALDDSLVDSIVPDSAPHALDSGSVVKMEVHNIGGLRQYRRWEVADIGVLARVYRSGRLLAQKIGVLQAKRLYPKNRDVEEEDAVDFLYGMNRFVLVDPTTRLNILETTYEFDVECTYAQLKAGSNQAKAINQFNREGGETVYYLFYNPPVVPSRIEYPVRSRRKVDKVELGCRVYSTRDVNLVLSRLRDGTTPTLGALERAGPSSNWHVETWAADLLLGCSVGQRITEGNEQRLERILLRRTGPIGAAILVSIDLPEG